MAKTVDLGTPYVGMHETTKINSLDIDDNNNNNHKRQLQLLNKQEGKVSHNLQFHFFFYPL